MACRVVHVPRHLLSQLAPNSHAGQTEYLHPVDRSQRYLQIRIPVHAAFQRVLGCPRFQVLLERRAEWSARIEKGCTREDDEVAMAAELPRPFDVARPSRR